MTKSRSRPTLQVSKEVAIAAWIAIICACIALTVMFGAAYTVRVQWPSGLIEMKPASITQSP